jgi:DNA-directed RNA polymerase subunit RPC12/RpoP
VEIVLGIIKSRQFGGANRRWWVMGKGYKCPVCDRQRVHLVSANKMRCSYCNSQYDKKVILSRRTSPPGQRPARGPDPAS